MSGYKIISDIQYGYIDVTLRSVLESRKINRYQLSNMTGIKFDIISKYYFNGCVQIDLTNLAKICGALNCNVEDIIKYHKIRDN